MAYSLLPGYEYHWFFENSFELMTYEYPHRFFGLFYGWYCLVHLAGCKSGNREIPTLNLPQAYPAGESSLIAQEADLETITTPGGVVQDRMTH